MERGYVERSLDSVGQEWILAHKDIRNGQLFDTNKHANKVLIFTKWSNMVESYLLSGSHIPDISEFHAVPTFSDIKAEPSLRFDTRIEILELSGGLLAPTDTKVGYFIEAPYGSGAFFTGTTLFSATGVYLTIGYTGSTPETGRARKILLRPYLQ
jgi:hypothetical protein